jgi:hypothetical protein
MRKHVAAFIAGLSGLCAAPLAAQDSRLIELTAPRALRSADALEVQVTTAPLPSGARVLVKTEQGDVLGVVTPFSLRPAESTATIAVPRSALVDGRLRLRLQVQEPGAPTRAARDGEVSARLVTPRD